MRGHVREVAGKFLERYRKPLAREDIAGEVFAEVAVYAILKGLTGYRERLGEGKAALKLNT